MRRSDARPIQGLS
jgi:hypothetical protein